MKYCIGIDPDLRDTGVAIAEKGKIIQVQNLSFHDLRTFFETAKPDIKRVYLEAGWLNKKVNWHTSMNAQTREKNAYNVGMNHAAGKLIEEMLTALDIPFLLIQPFARKKTHEEFVRMTGWTGKRTNQEVRDAGMLVYGHM